MLASTATGSSAAGTVGILAGTGGGSGAAAAALMNPVGIAVGAVIAVGIGGSEAVCYFKDERITEYHQVIRLMRELADRSDPEYFKLVEADDQNNTNAYILIHDAEKIHVMYRVRKLYVVNGVLMHRDLGKNTTIGNILFVKSEDDPN